MPFNSAELLQPQRTALVTQELQRGVVGAESPLPELARSAAQILPPVKQLLAAARAAKVLVIHCTALRRPDGKGANTNARIFQYMAKAKPLAPGSERAALMPGLYAEGDVVLSRLHGLSPFQGTELDFVLRNHNIATVVAVGVSVNVAITNLAFDAVNAAYQVVLPRDAVAGTPPEYAEQVFQHTLRNIATVLDSTEITAAWEAAAT